MKSRAFGTDGSQVRILPSVLRAAGPNPARNRRFFLSSLGPKRSADIPMSEKIRHVLSAVVHNVPGVLSHISGMLASRGYNIHSLAVGETEEPHLSRMTFVVVGDNRVLEQVRKQLEKIATVVRVDDISSQDFVERDLMLLKVEALAGPRRSEIRELVDIFRGKIVDVSAEHMMIELSGREQKIEAFVNRMRQFGIVELVRTGRIAMVRGQGDGPTESDNSTESQAD